MEGVRCVRFQNRYRYTHSSRQAICLIVGYIDCTSVVSSAAVTLPNPSDSSSVEQPDVRSDVTVASVAFEHAACEHIPVSQLLMGLTSDESELAVRTPINAWAFRHVPSLDRTRLARVPSHWDEMLPKLCVRTAGTLLLPLWPGDATYVVSAVATLIHAAMTANTDCLKVSILAK